MKTEIIEKINQLIKKWQDDDLTDNEFDKLDNLELELENIVLQDVCNIQKQSKNYENLTEKQQTFYSDIFNFLKKWATDKTKYYSSFDRSDRRVPSKQNIKITIKRIGELLNTAWNKKSFSNLIDEFSFIKDGDLFQYDGKYKHLRKDF